MKRQGVAVRSPPPKRARQAEEEETSSWATCKAWVESCGGIVDGVGCSEEEASRGVVVGDDGLREGACVLRIPLACCVLRADVEASRIGAVALAAAVWSEAREPLSAPAADVALAFFVATDSRDAGAARAPYYATLPTYVDLPRYWPVEHLDALLGGSPVKARIMDHRGGWRRDYDRVVRCAPEEAWPTFEVYDWACAMVATRSFTLAEGVDALVPLADLMNHSRDRETSYKVEDGAAVWRATRDMAPRAALHDTYGAKGNAQLLETYGFTMVANFEADGRSNDTRCLDLPGGRRVDLRVGTKVDAIIPFGACLDAFRAAQRPSDARAPSPDEEDFFDDEAGLGNDDDDDDDDDEDDDDDDEAKELWLRRVPVEIAALDALVALIREELRGYALADPAAILAGGALPPPPPGAADNFERRARTSAALVLNEQATLRFYERAAERCAEVLKAEPDRAADLAGALRVDAATAAAARVATSVSDRAHAAPVALAYLQMISCPAVAEAEPDN